MPSKTAIWLVQSKNQSHHTVFLVKRVNCHISIVFCNFDNLTDSIRGQYWTPIFGTINTSNLATDNCDFWSRRDWKFFHVNIKNFFWNATRVCFPWNKSYVIAEWYRDYMHVGDACCWQHQKLSPTRCHQHHFSPGFRSWSLTKYILRLIKIGDMLRVQARIKLLDGITWMTLKITK